MNESTNEDQQNSTELLEVVDQSEIIPPFNRNWGKIDWTGWCCGGTIYVGCTQEEYESLHTEEDNDSSSEESPSSSNYV